MLLLGQDGRLMPLGFESGFQRPLGAALVHCLDGSILDGLATAFDEQAVSPWCPLVIAAHVAVREETIRGLRSDAGRIATIRLGTDCDTPTFEEVRAAIGRRGRPSTRDVIAYLTRRTQDGLGEAVAHALDGQDSWSSALRRRLAVLGMPSPQHWMNLFWLATYLSAAEHPVPRTLEQVALEFNRAPRTVSAWCAKYLGCSWTQ
ncbi:MAG TPA: hypothetical protein VFI76_01370, partial [Terrimicrobiaceae bacterium]|nr:hypothetical protein [Terrimicrobiaceae bacterium]